MELHLTVPGKKTTKKIDYELFKEICLKININLHRSKKYLPEIIESAYKMNKSGKRKYTKEDILKQLSKMKV